MIEIDPLPVRRHRRAWRVVAGLALGLCLTACDRGSTPMSGKSPADARATPEAPARLDFDLFAFGRVLGTVAPCGCTTEPLGGLQYAFGWLDEQSSAGAFAVIEPGSFLFPGPEGHESPQSEAEWAQAHRRAQMLHTRFVGLGDALVSGVGPNDLRSPEGLGALASHPMPRVLANIGTNDDEKDTVLASIPGHRLVSLEQGGVTLKLGVTAVIDPSLKDAPGLQGLLAGGELTEAAGALREQVATMRKAGANVTVAMAHGERAFAEELARTVEGLDIMVVGVVDGLQRQRLGSAMARVGQTYVLEPGEQLQTVSHLRLSVDSKRDEVPPASDWSVVPPPSALRAELERVTDRITKFRADPEADSAFIARLEAEKARIEQQLQGKLEGDAVVTFEQVKITCRLAVDAPAKKALDGYDAWIAQSNKERFAGVKPPKPAKGKPGYVGVETCEDCHDEAVEHWTTTRHFGAYATLVDDNKQFDLSCVSCHVTGFREPGGSEVVENEGLTAVQCEVCHGPGSVHADDPTIDNIVTQITEDVCLGCHNPEHSDTFQYEAYLRDVLGTGHGESLREALGAGPTGRELRAAGFAKAGGACKNM
jgi:hypothetical protein